MWVHGCIQCFGKDDGIGGMATLFVTGTDTLPKLRFTTTTLSAEMVRHGFFYMLMMLMSLTMNVFAQLDIVDRLPVEVLTGELIGQQETDIDRVLEEQTAQTPAPTNCGNEEAKPTVETTAGTQITIPFGCRSVRQTTTIYAGPCNTFPVLEANVQKSVKVEYLDFKQSSHKACSDTNNDGKYADWALVSYPSIGSKGRGYIAANYLADCTPIQPGQRRTTCRKVVANNVNVRAGPCTTYPSIAVLNIGSQVTYTGSKYQHDSSCSTPSTTWALISYPYRSKGIAYINAAHLVYCPRTLDKKKFLVAYKKIWPFKNQAAENGLNDLLLLLTGDYRVMDLRWMAYILATVKHEVGDSWQPTDEEPSLWHQHSKDFGCKNNCYASLTTVKDPTTGKSYTNRYYGRGFVQLTWNYNYKFVADKLGKRMIYYTPELVKNDKSIAYEALVLGIINAWYSGTKPPHGLGYYIKPNDLTMTDYYNARRTVNGVDVASLIRDYAIKIEKMLRSFSTGFAG